MPDEFGGIDTRPAVLRSIANSIELAFPTSARVLRELAHEIGVSGITASGFCSRCATAVATMHSQPECDANYQAAHDAALRRAKARPCCGTTYDRTHLDECPIRGQEARAALPCDITSDGWCAAHSTGDGPVFCEVRQ